MAWAPRHYNLSEWVRIGEEHLPHAVAGWSWWQRLLLVFVQMTGHWPNERIQEAMDQQAAHIFYWLYNNLQEDEMMAEGEFWRAVLEPVFQQFGFAV